MKSLYTHIPNREGINASTNHLNKYDTTEVNIQMIQKMLELILDNNYFECDDEYYLQIHGNNYGRFICQHIYGCTRGKYP